MKIAPKDPRPSTSSHLGTWPPFALHFVCLIAACASAAPAYVPKLLRAPLDPQAARVAVSEEVAVAGYWAEEELGRAVATELVRELKACLTESGYETGTGRPEILLQLRTELSGYSENLVSTTVLEARSGGALLGTWVVRTPQDTTGPVDVGLFAGLVAVMLLNRATESGALRSEVGPPNEEATTPRPGQKAIILVFDIEDPDGVLRPEQKLALGEYLAVQLAREGRYRVTPRDQLREKLRTQSVESYRECFEDTCQIELGRALAAQKIASTRLHKVEDRCILTTTIYDLTTEASERAASSNSDCTESALFRSIEELARQSGDPAR